MEEELLELESRDRDEDVSLDLSLVSRLLCERLIVNRSFQDRRNKVMEQLTDAYEVEHELGYKVEELRKSIEDMGHLVGEQVRSKLRQSI